MIGMYQLLKILTVFPAIPRFRDKDVDNCVWAGITPIPSSFIGPPLAFAFEACSNNPAGKIKNLLYVIKKSLLYFMILLDVNTSRIFLIKIKVKIHFFFKLSAKLTKKSTSLLHT